MEPDVGSPTDRPTGARSGGPARGIAERLGLPDSAPHPRQPRRPRAILGERTLWLVVEPVAAACRARADPTVRLRAARFPDPSPATHEYDRTGNLPPVPPRTRRARSATRTNSNRRVRRADSRRKSFPQD